VADDIQTISVGKNSALIAELLNFTGKYNIYFIIILLFELAIIFNKLIINLIKILILFQEIVLIKILKSFLLKVMNYSHI
jgi:hypothetical protein